ncbi:unnamed protein product, partial [Rotaria magnacalcarata]
MVNSYNNQAVVVDDDGFPMTSAAIDVRFLPLFFP